LSVLFIGIVGGMIKRVVLGAALPEWVAPISYFGGADTLRRGTLGRVGVPAHRSMLVAILFIGVDIMALGDDRSSGVGTG